MNFRILQKKSFKFIAGPSKSLMFYALLHMIFIAGSINVSFAQLNQETRSQIDEFVNIAQANESKGNKTEAVHYYNQAANLCWKANILHEAGENFKKALALNEETNNFRAVMIISNNLGFIYSDIEDFKQATEYFKKALGIARSNKDKQSIADGLINTATALQAIPDHKAAVQYLEEAIEITKELNNLKLLRKCYGAIASSHESLGNSEKAFEYYEVFASINKKLTTDEMSSVKKTAESQVSIAKQEKELTEVELTKKNQILKLTEDTLVKAKKLTYEQQMELDLKNAELREQKAVLEKRRWVSIFFASVAIFIALLALLLYVQFKNKKKANILLAKQNVEINNQKDILDKQNKHIKASINYAMTIQQAILPIKDSMDKYFNSFIIYRPKDIVSGDFYWFSQFTGTNKDKDILLIAVVDCTGHGVPGAFMSMIGNRLLNEIVNERKVHDPKQILEILSSETRIALKQDKTDNNDGMDVCLCSIEKIEGGKTKVIFSGAKRPLFYHTNNMPEVGVIKGDRRSIGGVNEERQDANFTNHELLLNVGDNIYLTSDGIIDQHGNNRKRFGTLRLLDKLMECIKVDSQEQKKLLETAIDDYICDEEQRDDITIIGINIL